MERSQEKPLITFGLMAYNDARFVGEALAAAFSQTYEPLEIILSDDSSTDGTAEMLEKMAADYRGPHRIVLNKNRTNLGISGHINRIMELCSGEIMVIAAADDISLPHRVQRIYEAFQDAGGKAFSIHSSCLLINDKGGNIGIAQEYESYETDLETVIDYGTWLYGCTHAWHRDIFDKFGALPVEVIREDEVLPFRSLLLGTIGYIREPLVLYRLHQKNVSRENRRQARDRADLQDLIFGKHQERLVNLTSYLSDLEKADRVDPGRKQALREKLLSEIDYCQVEMTLRKGSLKEKAEMLRQQTRLDPARAMKLFLRMLFPQAYMYYSYHRYKKSADSGGETFPYCGPRRISISPNR